MMKYAGTFILLVPLSVPSLRASDFESASVEATELKVPPGFRAERLLRVPRSYASWVNMAFDAQGRILLSHQGNKMHRVRPAPLGDSDSRTTVEPLDIGLGGTQGLLYEQGQLFAVVNGNSPRSGVYRVQDQDGQGDFAEPELLFPIDAGGEHGPHGIVRGNDGWLYLIAGNATPLPAGITRQHVAFPRSRAGYKAPKPQGWVLRFRKDGSERELLAMGLRNAYDLAVSGRGEIFTFDSDNEGFYGLPWYRPTNVYHILAGADYGWRQGPENLRPSDPDNLPPICEVGPGSPTGMVFGTQTHFPEEYRSALFVSDWSYGRIYAVRLVPAGASFSATWSFFASGRPLATTDLAPGPDGALYFVTGGRGTQSTLYRIYWTGELVSPIESPTRPDERLRKRRGIQTLLGTRGKHHVQIAWQDLNHEDRTLAFLARTLLEQQPIAEWKQQALTESDPDRKLAALLALARQSEEEVWSESAGALSKLAEGQLTDSQRHHLLRTYAVLIERFGLPKESAIVDSLSARLLDRFPSEVAEEDRQAASLLFEIVSDRPVLRQQFADRVIAVLQRTASGMEQIHYLRILALLAEGTLSEVQAKQLAMAVDPEQLRILAGRPYPELRKMVPRLMKTLQISPESPAAATRPFIKKWKPDDLAAELTSEQLSKADLDRGRVVFRTAGCSKCHRIGDTGGVLGPALNGLAGRYSPREVLESILEPSKVIADQYRPTEFVTTDGRVLRGMIVNLDSKGYLVQTDPLRPFARITVSAEQIEQQRPAATSTMPEGVLDTFERSEIRDLVAYLLGPLKSDSAGASAR